ncbi:MAG: hypothetical protein ABUT20_57625 [Bacteroidota bacterium]
MNEDLITDNFAENINRAIVKRNFIISKLLLALSMLWSVVLLIDWYRFLKGRNEHVIEGTYMIYNYIILPISDVINLGLSVYAFFLILKAYGLIESSLKDSDGNLMSEGFRHFYTGNLLTAICYSISITTTFISFLL